MITSFLKRKSNLNRLHSIISTNIEPSLLIIGKHRSTSSNHWCITNWLVLVNHLHSISRTNCLIIVFTLSIRVDVTRHFLHLTGWILSVEIDEEQTNFLSSILQFISGLIDHTKREHRKKKGGKQTKKEERSKRTKCYCPCRCSRSSRCRRRSSKKHGPWYN